MTRYVPPGPALLCARMRALFARVRSVAREGSGRLLGVATVGFVLAAPPMRAQTTNYFSDTTISTAVDLSGSSNPAILVDNDATFTISSTGSLNAADVSIGSYYSDYGGPTWNGSLLITGGGDLTTYSTSGASIIGDFKSAGVSGIGIATVTGAGSTWVSSNQGINIGYDGGVGTLNITNGGSVQSKYSNIGSSGGTGLGTGYVTVSGAGSTFSLINNLYIGNGGTGTLTVSSSGTTTVASGNGSVLFYQGTVNIGAASTDTAAAGGVINASSIDVNTTGTTTLQFNTTGTAASATYFTKDGTATGTGVNYNGYTNSTLVNTAGYTVFTGTITAPGGITVNGGAIQIGNGGTTGSLSGNVVDNASVVFKRSDAITYSGAISGSGALTQAGSGTLTLTGNNTYSGGTTISAGTLQAGSGGTTGSITGNVTDNGTLAFNRADDISFSGVVSGSGTLSKSGAGTLTLTAANTYSGGTTLASGTLGLGADNAIGSGTLTITGGNLRASGSARTLTNAVTLSGDFTLGRATTLAGAITLTKSVTLTSGNPDAGSPTTSTISGVISGNYGLTFVDGTNPIGAIVLSGANTYTGNTTLQSGTLTLANSLALQNSTLDYQGGTLDFGSLTSATFGGLNGNQALALTNGSSAAVALTVGGNNASTTYSAAISGAGSLTKTGTGTLALTGANTYTGGTTISGGTLQIGSGGTAGSITGNITDDAAVVFNRSDAVNYTSVISGSGSLTQAGAGTLTLSGANTYSGGTTLNAGSIAIASASALGSGGLTFGGGTLANTAAVSLSSGVTLNSGGGTLATTGGDLALSGVISGSGALTKSGSGTLTLTGANTYTSTTTISGGTLQIGNGGTSGTITGNVVDNSALVFNRSDDLSYSGVVSGSGTLTKSGAGALYLYSTSTYTGGTTLNAGILGLGADNALGTGALTINGGNLRAANAGRTLTNAVVLNGDFTLGRSTNLAGAITLTKDITITSANPDTDAGPIFTSTLSGVISGNYGLTFTEDTNPSGKIVLSGNNTYTGTTTLSAGTLQIGSGDTTGSVAGNIVDNGTLIFNRSDAVTYGGAISGTGSVTQAGSSTLTLSGDSSYTGGTTISSGTLQVGNGGTTGSITGNTVDNGALVFNRSDTLAYSGLISGSGTLTQSGSGTLTLGSANAYTGGTTLNAGTLGLGNDSALGTGTLTINGGTLRATGSARTLTNAVIVDGDFTLGRSTNLAGSITLTKNVTITSANPDTSAATTSTLSGVISGNYGLAFADGTNPTGAIVLAGANTYTGNTQLQSGTLTLANSLALQNSTFDFQGGTLGFGSLTTATFGGLNGTQAFALANASSAAVALTVGGNSASTADSGALSGSGSLTKIGSGTLMLSGANTYTGGTTISAGTLQIGNGSSSGSIAGNIVDNAALVFNRSGTLSYGGIISGTGTLTKTGSGTLTLTGANTYTGATTVSGGTLALAGGDNRLATTSTLYLTGGGTLDLGGNEQTFGGLGSVSSRLVGTITAGTITTTGNTYLQSGTYAATFTGSSATARLWIGGDASATVTLNGTNDAVYTADHNQVIIGYTATGAAGTVKLGNANALAAATENAEVFSGTLDLNGQANVRANSIALQSGAASALVNNNTSSAASYAGTVVLANNNSNLGGNGDLTLSGTLSGTSFTKAGAGTLTLANGSFFTDPNSSYGVSLSAGALALGSSGTTYDFSNTVFSFDYGTLKFASTGNTTVTGGLYTDTSSYIDSAYGGIRFDTAGQNVTLADAMISGDALAKTGAGTLKLTDSGSGYYSYGSTYVTEGTLALTKTGQLGTSNLMIGSDYYPTRGTLDLGGTTQTLSSGAETDIYAGTLTDGTLATDGQIYVLGSATLDANFTGSGSSARLWINADAGSTVYLGGSNDRVFTSDHNQVIIGYSGGPTVELLSSTALTAATENVEVWTGTLDLNGQTDVRANAIVMKSGASSALVNNSTSSGASFAGGVTLSSGSAQLGGAGQLTLSGILSGTGGLTKIGAGTLSLTGANTYTGGTSISAGKLVVNGSIDSSSLTTINAGGMLGGSGTVGALVVASGGILAPGNSPGTLSAGNTTFAGGGTMQWQVNNVTGTAGTNWDQLAITGGLTLSATSANPFKLELSSLTLANTTGNAANFNSAADYSFTFLTTTTGVSGFASNAFAIDTTQFTNPFAGTWSVSLTNGGRDLSLTYAGSAIPEPATYAMLAGLAVLGVAWARRRNSRQSWPTGRHAASGGS